MDALLSFCAGSTLTLGALVLVSRLTRKDPPSADPREDEIRAKLQIPKPAQYVPDFAQKLVVGMRTDVKMKTGEFASLLSDAVIAECASLTQSSPEVLSQWYRFGQAKIAVKVPNGETMDTLVASALDASVPYTVKHANGEPMAIAIGPDFIDKVNAVSGKLKLL